jgi:hypothetical protein
MSRIAPWVSRVSGVCEHRYMRRFCGLPARATLTRSFFFFLLRYNQPARNPDTDLGRQTRKTPRTWESPRRARMYSGEADDASHNHRALVSVLSRETHAQHPRCLPLGPSRA